MRRASRTAGALGVAAALGLAAACGDGGSDSAESTEQRLIEMLNENAVLEADLTAAESRIITDCLEGQGFTVHDAYTMEQYEPTEVDTLTYEAPHESWLPEAEEAAEYGFGAWAESPDAPEGEAEDYWAMEEEKYTEEYGGEEEEYEEPDNSEFEALSPQEQYDWWVAYYGEEKAKEYDAYLLDPEYDPEEEFSEGDPLAGELDENGGEGEIELEGEEEYVDPKPGGCELEMIEGLYGEPELVEHTEEYEGESETWSEWTYRPTNPEYAAESTMYEDIDLAYLDEMGDLPYDFTTCLSDAGHDGWEFGEGSYLPTYEYFGQMYWEGTDEEEMYSDTGDMEIPELPDDAPTEYEDQKAYEIEVATAFADCGKDLDYTAKSTEAWDKANIDAYAAIEEDVFAYQDEMRAAIEKAQEMLDA